ncbi:MAG: hypothetical protein R3321_01325 [Nitrososphaeraceae archaeon]|nr:hypothetical protein [Nitrososphaeraceae archaeon]
MANTRKYTIFPNVVKVKYNGEYVTENFIEGVKYKYGVDINDQNVEFYVKKVELDNSYP